MRSAARWDWGRVAAFHLLAVAAAAILAPAALHFTMKRSGFDLFLADIRQGVVPQLPDLEIRRGMLRVKDAEEPYYVRDLRGGEPLIAFDSTPKLQTVAGTDLVFLFRPDRIVYLTQDGSVAEKKFDEVPVLREAFPLLRRMDVGLSPARIEFLLGRGLLLGAVLPPACALLSLLLLVPAIVFGILAQSEMAPSEILRVILVEVGAGAALASLAAALWILSGGAFHEKYLALSLAVPAVAIPLMIVLVPQASSSRF